MRSDEEIKIKKSQLENLVEQKIEEKLSQKQKNVENQDSNKITRRNFLKKLGVGTIGLGAASIIPNTTALNINDSNGLKVYQNSQKYLDISSSAVNIINTQLQEQGNRIATRNWTNNNSVTSVNGKTGNIQIDTGSLIFGNGARGEITRTTNGDETEILNTTTYKIESGVTRMVSNGIVIIYAKNEIIINGTLDAAGQGAEGGTGGNGGSGGDAVGGNSGSSGNNGLWSGGGGSPGGGGSTFGGGGSGGSGGSTPEAVTDQSKLNALFSGEFQNAHDLTNPAPGSGAGGGGGGGSSSEGSSSTDANPGENGEPGGSGGGSVFLIAPQITINGVVDVSGEPGGNGGDGANAAAGGDIVSDGGSGGGGGVGASAGLIYLVSNNITGENNLIGTGGEGGVGGAAGSGSQYGDNGDSGGNGEKGADALIIKHGLE